ncbi:hypothetical protein C7S13_5274 [Burkholderia cepacia]|nr:hypothetical protein [Burkholderia cepacia]QOH38359.1 hypothetical protein C7S14_3040 [Burkholderia cepacia]
MWLHEKRGPVRGRARCHGTSERVRSTDEAPIVGARRPRINAAAGKR